MGLNIWLGNDSGNEGDYSVTANWSLGAIPTTGDDVIVPAGSPSISAGLNQSAVAISDFIVEPGYTNLIGTKNAFLQIDPDVFDFAGSGQSFIDIGSAAIPVLIRQTKTLAAGQFGLHLDGSAITVLRQITGQTRCHGQGGFVATTIEIVNGEILVPAGSTLTNLKALGGTSRIEVAATLVEANNGAIVYTEGSGAVTTIQADNAALVYSSASGTVGTARVDGNGVISFLQSRTARTLTNAALSGTGRIYLDTDYITLTNPPTSNGTMTLAGGVK